MNSSSVSDIFTDQRNEDSCSYHAAAKVLLQNVWQYFMPVKVDTAKFIENNCARFVDFDIYDTNMEDLTEEMCGTGGYEKILQFLYIYYLIEDHVTRGKDAPATIGAEILPFIFAQKIPNKFEASVHRPYLVDMLTKLNTAYTESKLKYVEIYIDGIVTSVRTKKTNQLLLDIIKKLLEKGLYIFAGLDEPGEEGHAVHIINVIGDEIVIKNSWGDNRVHQMKLNGYTELSDRPFRLSEMVVYVPVPLDQEDKFGYDNYHTRLTMDMFLEQVYGCVSSIVARHHIREQSKPRIFHRGDIVEYKEKQTIFLTYMPDKMADIWDGDDIEMVRVVDLRTPAPVWDKAKNILERLVHDDEQSITRVRSSLEAKQAKRVRSHEQLKTTPDVQKSKDVKIMKQIEQLKAKLEFVQRDHYMSSAALERVNKQQLFQYKPKKTRKSTE
jgi:hypothetical protein